MIQEKGEYEAGQGAEMNKGFVINTRDLYLNSASYKLWA